MDASREDENDLDLITADFPMFAGLETERHRGKPDVDLGQGHR